MPKSVRGSGPQPGTMQYDWPRFWVKQTGIIDLSDFGFLQDPMARFSGGSSLRTLAELEADPALALLGEPGIGKSSSLHAESVRYKEANKLTDSKSFYLDLNSVSDGALNRTGFPGGSNFQVEWSYDEQDDEQIQP